MGEGQQNIRNKLCVTMKKIHNYEIKQPGKPGLSLPMIRKGRIRFNRKKGGVFLGAIAVIISLYW